MERDKLKSRIGFILISAGCAIGIGNVWKFPYVVGENGGGLFVLIYLFFLLVFGVPILTMEFSLGRAAQKSPVKLYQQLEKPGHKWHIHGYFCLAGNYLLMMFYTTVAGWMINYFVSMISGKFNGLDSAGISETFKTMQSDPLSSVLFMGIAVVVGFAVCALGVQGGLEKITKVMMVALLAILVVLAVNSVIIDIGNGGEGLSFYLLPDFDRAAEIGIFNVIVAAMNQSFFTLSIGIGSMAIFGSYIGKERSLLGESVNIALLDTFVAVASGLIIFPACFANDVAVNAGPGLIFETLPNVFNQMQGGQIWGSLFFVFMSFAALSTVFAVFENIISCTSDLFGWSRKKACIINAVTMFVLSLPCSLGFGLLSGVTPLGEGSTILDFEDFLVSNILLPLGSIAFIIFCVSRYGWGWNKFEEEANCGKGLKVKRWMRGYMTWVLPVAVAAVFFVGIYNTFWK
ncbi:MAG: sodium-dependent transporter [Oscillospiraceae bacterium]|nr:sodium-dependent transporter [Oscillospiraceae bacterium]